MPKIKQPKAIKGSQHWLQELVNQRPDLLADCLRPQLGLNGDDTITWLSPLEADGYAEYQDEAFLKRLSADLVIRPLRSFWPSGGPVWDGLGKTSRGDVLLIEAKAHISELASPPSRACQPSLTLIQKSLAEAKQFFGATSTTDWSHGYYQYANRLAHLYLLRGLNGIPARLVFLYFVNADDVTGPKSAEGWRDAIEAAHMHLGVTPVRLGPHVNDVFFDVTTLQNPCRPNGEQYRIARI